MNVMVRPIKQRKSKRLNVDAEHSQLDDQIGFDKEDNQNISSFGDDPYDADNKPRLENENSQGAPPERINDPSNTTTAIAPSILQKTGKVSVVSLYVVFFSIPLMVSTCQAVRLMLQDQEI